MNVLILTPDRVGSTLLQRLVTVYMLEKGFNKPVINLHELTNGLVKYFNHNLGQEVLGKPDSGWSYLQSLEDITQMLNSTDHYKTSRLAHYHLVRRNDSLDSQLKFYEYLNNNFYVISCRRQNLFEHGISWTIQAHSKKLNVFSPQEKIQDFNQIYKNGITVSREGLEKYLTAYVDYIKWSDSYFNIQSYFDYDTNIKDIESYILNLDFMQGNTSKSWQDMFGQSFSNWNACHRMIPNLFLRDQTNIENAQTLSLSTTFVSDKSWQNIRGKDWPLTWAEFDQQSLPKEITTEIQSKLSLQNALVTTNEYDFLKENLPAYKNSIGKINQLQEHGYLITGIPLKLQSLQEKKSIIKNFSDCVLWYNEWVDKNNYGKHYTETELDLLAAAEESNLTLPVQQISYINGKFLSS